jgi:hypothetical protein
MVKLVKQGVLSIFLFGSAMGLQAQTSAPKYSNEFLSIGVGARALAMAGAQVASVNDVTSGYWNPAGLVGSDSKSSLALMHAEYFAGIAKYDYAAYLRQIDSTSALSVSLIRFGVDDIPDTRFLFDDNGNLNYDNVRFFSAADYGLFLSYARKVDFLPGLKLGGSAKVVHRSVGQFANSWGFGLDAGAQLSRNNWNFGLMLRDITTTFNAWTFNNSQLQEVYVQTGNELPESSLEITLPRAVLGVSRNLQLTQKINAQVAVDLVSTFDGQRNTLIKSRFASIDPVAGLELGYGGRAWLRFGAGQFQKIQEFDGSERMAFQPTAGLGVLLGSVSLDYAYVDVGNVAEAPSSHVFSLKINFDR